MATTESETRSEGIELGIAINQAIASIDSRMNPLSRARAAERVAARLNSAMTQVAERRRNAVSIAVTMPGMSMQKVADELDVSKSMVAKLAGPASARNEIAAEMRERLQAAFEFGAKEATGRAR